MKFGFLILLISFFGCYTTTVKKPLNIKFIPAKSENLTQPDFRKDNFLDSLKKSTYGYFEVLSNPQNGLIPDRGPNISFCSIGAVGFGLSSYLVGVENHYLRREEAARRVLITLRFFVNSHQGTEISNSTGYQGFYYHFLDMENGFRYKEVELSTIDTGLLMMGILSCESYFDKQIPEEEEIRDLAEKLYARVNWTWASVRPNLISMGWNPESGFLNSDYHGYCEAMFLYILALGSPLHSISPKSWNTFTKTDLWGKYENREMINFGPLFGHQYSQIWIDFRGIQDSVNRSKGIDYFENSKRAALANQSYCIKNPKRRLGYDSLTWGLTACDGPGDMERDENGIHITYQGYSARGAAKDYNVDDGTLAPTAVGGSTPFIPGLAILSLKHMKQTYGDKIYRKFGFIDAFNPSFQYTPESRKSEGYFDSDYLGIDEGPILLMVENYQTEFLWNLMKKNPHIVLGLKRAGFKGGWIGN